MCYSPRVKELKAQQYLDTKVLQRFNLEGFGLCAYKSLRSFSLFLPLPLLYISLTKPLSLEEDITCADIKGEIATRMRVRRTDVEMFLTKPDGTTIVSLPPLFLSFSLFLSLFLFLFIEIFRRNSRTAFVRSFVRSALIVVRGVEGGREREREREGEGEGERRRERKG